MTGNDVAVHWWRSMFDRVYSSDRKLYDAWDAQWLFMLWCRNGLSITPNTNLVTNIGFGPDATHTAAADEVLGEMPLEEMDFPLSHPSCFVRCIEADDFAFEVACKPKKKSSLYALARDWTPRMVRGMLRRAVVEVRSPLNGR